MRVRLLMLAAVAACNPPPSPQPQLDLDDFDFGTVPSGTTATRDVVLHNTGATKLTLLSVEIDDPAFVLQVVKDAVIPAGTSSKLTISFDSKSSLYREHRATLTLHARDGTQAKATLTAVSAFIDCPRTFQSVIFPGVYVGETIRQQLKIFNASSTRITFVPGPISGDDPLAFEVGSSSVETGPGQDYTLELAFTPGAAREHRGRLALSSGVCSPLEVAMTGYGVEKLLGCAIVQVPRNVPGVAGLGMIEIRNWSGAPVDVSQLAIAPAPEFRLRPLIGPATVPAAHTTGNLLEGRLRIELEYTPAMYGVRTGTFSAATSRASEPVVGCEVQGLGAGPDVEVRPLVLDIPSDGTVYYLTIRNVAPPQGADGALLLFGITVDPPGTPLSVGATPETIPAGGYVDIPISSTVAGTWQLVLMTGDPDEDRVSVTVHAGP